MESDRIMKTPSTFKRADRLNDYIAASETRLRAVRAQAVALTRSGGDPREIGRLTIEAARINRELGTLRSRG